MEKIINNEKINTGRQPEIDIIKGIAVMLMVVNHVFEHFAEPSFFWPLLNR